MEKDFIDQLTTIPLTQRQYLSAGLERDYVLWRISSFYVRKRPAAWQTRAKDPLLRAVLHYELQYLTIGPLYFNDSVSTDDDYFRIGGFDTGLLCICRRDHTVRVVRNIHYPESVYNTGYYCGESNGLFLDALIAAAIYLEKCIVSENLSDMPEMRESMIKFCSDMAGVGSSDFFRVLIEGPSHSLFW